MISKSRLERLEKKLGTKVIRCPVCRQYEEPKVRTFLPDNGRDGPDRAGKTHCDRCGRPLDLVIYSPAKQKA